MIDRIQVSVRTKMIFLLMVWGLAGMTLCGQTLELDNDTLHLKLDLTRGGAINYISTSGSDRNIVNIHDEGRYIQQSYYAGQSLNRVADGQNPSWSPWSWNPIQVGDSYNNRAEILEQSVDGNTAYTRCIPMLWDMNNEPAEAEMEQWTTLMGNVIKVHNKLTCMRTDDIWNEGVSNHQELPAVYPISDLDQLYSYFGNSPFTGGPLDHPAVVNLSSGFWGRYDNDRVTENWMAFVDDQLWGMGVYTPISNNFLAGMAGSPGGEALDGSTSYIAPVKSAVLNKNTVYEYDYYLVVGTLNQIRSEIYSIKGVQPYAWEFEDDLEGWSVDPQGGTVQQSQGSLEFTVTAEDPSVSAEVDPWEVGRLKYLWMKVQNQTAGDAGAIRFLTYAEDSASVPYVLTPNDTEFKDVLVKLDTMDIWSVDTIFSTFKLLPVSGNNPGSVMVDFIRFLESLIQVRSEGDVLEITGMGKSLQLYAEEVPGMGAADVDWSVDPPGIASVNTDGLVTSVSAGLAKVTATANDGSGESDSILIEVFNEGQKNSWEFVYDVEGWDKNEHACMVSHEEEALKVSVTDVDPYVSNNVSPWTVGDLKYLWMRIKNHTSGNGGSMYLFPSEGGHDFVPYPMLPNDTAYRDVFVDMRAAEKWKKDLVIGSLRLDANNGGETGDIFFDFIRFKEELVAVTSEGDATEIVGLGNTLQLYATELVEREEPVVFEWSADTSGVATVDASGLVTAVNEGLVMIRASDVDSTGIAGEIAITVTVDHTSVEGVETTPAGIYPNPAGSVLNLWDAHDLASMSVISMSGQVIIMLPNVAGTSSINIGSLKPGIYVLRTTNKEGKQEYHHFVKK